MTSLGYHLVKDDGRVFYWEKKGPFPNGLEDAARSWPAIVSKHYPLFAAEGQETLVYDRSDVTDLIVEITGTGRANSARIGAILRTETGDTQSVPFQLVDMQCGKCGEKSAISEWRHGADVLPEKRIDAVLTCPKCGSSDDRILHHVG
ncbi:MAG: hypothetical protein WC670_07875 [Pseudolabrys sp.]